jgi:hypothetical protein
LRKEREKSLAKAGRREKEEEKDVEKFGNIYVK